MYEVLFLFKIVVLFYFKYGIEIKYYRLNIDYFFINNIDFKLDFYLVLFE